MKSNEEFIDESSNDSSDHRTDKGNPEVVSICTATLTLVNTSLTIVSTWMIPIHIRRWDTRDEDRDHGRDWWRNLKINQLSIEIGSTTVPPLAPKVMATMVMMDPARTGTMAEWILWRLSVMRQTRPERIAVPMIYSRKGIIDWLL